MLVAIDVGYAQVKGRTKAQELVLPSYVARDPGVMASGRLAGEIDMSVTDEKGTWWLVGDQAIDHALTPMSSVIADRSHDPVFMILLRAALAYLCEGEHDVDLVIGLPPEQSALKDDLVARIVGTHNIIARLNDQVIQSTVHIRQVRIPPQPLGTFHDMLLDVGGEPQQKMVDTPMYYGNKLVVDIGGGTTDIVGIQALKPLRPVMRTIRQGMHWVYGELRKTKRQLPVARIERMVLAGDLDPSGPVEELATLINVEVANLLDVTGFEPDLLIITGGPAKLFRHLLTVPGAETVLGDDCSNVRGYLKWGSRAKTFAAS